jgi:hypothetical protein
VVSSVGVAIARHEEDSLTSSWKDAYSARRRFTDASLILVDLEPGTYTAASFFKTPDGATDAESGMVTQFTVE